LIAQSRAISKVGAHLAEIPPVGGDMQRLTADDPSSSEIIRAAGLSPDDASNFVPAPERVAERIAGDQPRSRRS
jgi:hypothetical protein